jgi:PAS domain S-box-containing protein
MKFSNLRTATQLSIGGFALLIILFLILGVSYFQHAKVDSVTNRISNLRTPTVQASIGLKSSFNSTLAALRGWALLKDQHFIVDRKKAWELMRESQRQLNTLSSGWTNPDNVARLKEMNVLLDEFEVSQDKIEFLAWHESNLPATQLLFSQALPRAEVILESITKLMEIEQYVPTTMERKKLFNAMANFRGSFAISLAQTEAFLISADPLFSEKFADSWHANEMAYALIQKHSHLFDENQKEAFSILVKFRAKFASLPKKIFDLRRKDDWNLANYELKSTAGPLAEKLSGILENILQNQIESLELDTVKIDSIFHGYLDILIWLSLLSIFTVVGVSFFIKRKVGDPLNAAIEGAIKLAERVASGQYLSEPEFESGVASSYETSRLLASLRRMNVEVKNQARDLSTAKESAEIAQQKAETARFAMDQHSLVSIADIDGNMTLVNQKFMDVSGYSKEELLGKNHRLLNSGNQPKEYWKEMYETVSRGEVWHDEVRNIAKSGHYYWVDTTIVPNYEAGQFSGFTSIRTEITQQKENQISLEVAKEEAEAANESKADFLANMSHEIRTPMNGVIGMTNLLLDTDLTDNQFKLAKTVKSSGEGLLGIINDILDFSKVEAGKLELEYLNFNLGRLVEDLGSTMYYQAEAKDLQLICPANPIIHQSVNGDPGRIRQILTNLVGNAIKFTHQGEIALFVRIDEKENNRKQIHFEIKDSGIGLSEEQQGELFDKFTQADSSTTRKYGGTGLGLSISKKLVELMGGEIGVTSTLGRGSTFWFTIELDAVKNIIESPENVADLTSQKVLIVDDNATNRELMRQLHEIWGIPHTLVSSGQQALDELQKEADKNTPYSIAILDMQMPEMDGLELCKRITDNPALKDTRLIMASSQTKRGDANKMQSMGFKGYLTKPIHQSDLFDVLQRVSDLKFDKDSLITRHNSHDRQQFTGHVLVVEDNATNQLVIEGLLTKFGLSVDLAANGVEALAALSRGNVHDIVVMDCQMPVMDGYTATKKIRDPESGLPNPAIPIIAMTANAMAGDKQKCLNAGMDDYVSKPVSPQKVIEMLERWLPEKAEPITKEDKPLNTKNSLPIFDYQAMSDRLMGDQALMQAVFETFSKDFADEIIELVESLNTHDAGQVAKIAHKMKGASANVGGMALSALTLELELASKDEDLNMIRQKIHEIEDSFSTLKATMKEKLS